MPHAGLVALFLSAAFCGAAFYISLVEQPARLSLDDRAMLAEWRPSDHRGLAMLAGLALLAAGSGLAAYAAEHDLRWLIGGIIVMATWPYMFFLLVPVNNRLLAATSSDDAAAARALVRDWGLLEWGLGLIGLAASAVFGWALW